MPGNYLSVIVLFDAWQDAGRGAATASLIRHTRTGLPGEERGGEDREQQSETGREEKRKKGREGRL